MKSLVNIGTKGMITEIPTAVIKQRLKKIFNKHIGREKGIVMPRIYLSIYGKEMVSKYQYVFRCQKIANVMTQMRKKSFYFIVGENGYNGYIYFIVKSRDEANDYKNIMNDRIKGLEGMKKRVDIAVKNKFYRRLI